MKEPWLYFDPTSKRSNLKLLNAIHQLVQPRLYCEIGVRWGDSLALASKKTFSVAVDPEPDLRCPLPSRAILLRQTSDLFFKRHSWLRWVSPFSFDLGLIDGMHLSEFVVRDFIGLERMMARSGVIVLDDTNPSTEEMTSRTQCAGAWTGDVWKLLSVLKRYRPDLNLMTFDVQPTGLTIVSNLDPKSRVLQENYGQIISELEALRYGKDFREDLQPMLQSYSSQTLLDYLRPGYA